MAKRIGGSRRKTRHMMLKSHRQKGKISLTRCLQQLNVGERVLLKAESAVQSALYFRRFHGLIGTVTGKRGRCYEVAINDQNQKKMVIVHPAHLHKC